MMTLRAIRSGVNYRKHVEYSDYLDKENTVEGQWFGEAAKSLGLTGAVEMEAFERLRECDHPETGEFLRQRQGGERYRPDGTKQSEPVAMIDLTFSAPKSVSIVGVMEDPRLLDAQREAVAEALAEVQKIAAVEDQRGGQKLVRQTGNVAIATYQHDTSRQLDPQIHTHAVLFNLSYDKETESWKALHSPSVYQRRAYLTEVYRNALARKVMALGYEIENRWNNRGTDLGFEIKGVSRELIEKYSKRSQEKEEAIRQFIEKNGKEPSNDQVSVLVRETRDDDLREITTAEVRKHQRSQLTQPEATLLRGMVATAQGRGNVAQKMTAREALEFAKEDIFERHTVALDHEILQNALIYGRGQVSFDELKKELETQLKTGAMIGTGGILSSKESAEREARCIALVNQGTGIFERLGGQGREPEYHPSGNLSAEQNAAVKFVLNSKDRAVCIQGAAGTGKTETLRHLRRELMDAGHSVVAIAPTAPAVSELRERGFSDAMTIELALGSPQQAAKLAGKVVIVDEAGMVSGRQMVGILEMAQKHGCRLVMVGDVQQIKSVEAGDYLRVLQNDSKLQTAEIKQVQRQSVTAMGGRYRPLTETMWRDREKGFQMLEEAKAIDQVHLLERADKTVEAVLEAKAQLSSQGKGDRVLVVAPTHAEIDRYNDAIRDHLKNGGKLKAGKEVGALQPINWTEARRKDARNYQPGMALVFHKATNGAKKHETFTVLRTEGGKIVCRSDQSGKETSFTKKQAGSFGVFHRQGIEVAIGDQLLLQTNRQQRSYKKPDGTKEKGVKFENGEIVAVKMVGDDGRIHLQDGRVLPADYRQFKHGYAVTAHKSQGKTVDAVVVTADRMEGDLFYVAVSRGRELVRVLTSDKKALKKSVIGNSGRMSATELVKKIDAEKRLLRRRRWQRIADSARKRAKTWQQVFLKLYLRGHDVGNDYKISRSLGGQSPEKSHDR